ncbi:pre-60S factor REI1 [Nematocida sp. AWRm80]|nr:pre-60S factor REI1 [Nematocida sp. AWRm80]
MKCSACNIEINPEEISRHYKDQIHEENLRRKSLGMPPLSVEEVIPPQVSEEVPKEEKHKVDQGDGTHTLQPHECLYCGEIIKEGVSLERSNYLVHMQKHGFKLLLPNYISDLPGLVNSLSRRIEECRCTFCNKRFSNIHKARSHMLTLGHARYVNSEDFSEYYTYPERPVGYVTEDGTELYLPSGRIAGNKKYSKYYAQTLRDPEYYKQMDPIKIKFEEQQLTLQKEKIEYSAEAIKQITKYDKRTQKNALKVSKAANNQKTFREDWMQ